MECEGCGLRPSDLPDEVDTELVFETVEGIQYCMSCIPIDAHDNFFASEDNRIELFEEDYDR